jgi:hypothetical protein
MAHRDVEREGDNASVQTALRVEQVVVDRKFDDAGLLGIGDFSTEELRQEESLEGRNMGFDGLLEG